MIWITRILFLFLVLASIMTFSTLLSSKRDKKEVLAASLSSKRRPKKSFFISQAAYDNLGEGLLGSKSHRFKKSLEESLKFLGANTRPDYPVGVAFFSYKGKALVFNEKETYPLSLISEDDLEGSSEYFFEIESSKERVDLKLFHNKTLSFNLSLLIETAILPTQIGGYKLDNYLLIRQKISWMGQDLFLKDYGGEEFEETSEGERLDFMHLSPPYYLFAKHEDLFAWKDNKWQKAKGDSKEYPLMAIEKIDLQTMEVSVWDVTGRQKEKIVLSKSRANPIPKALASLKFIGAKSNQKWLFKADKTRMTLETGDWLVNLGYKWEKINSVDAIDQYVGRLNMGELFVVKELSEQNGKKVLKGSLYNVSRTEKVDYTLDVSQDSKAMTTVRKKP